MTENQRNVVVIGATGHFGARICRRLLNETEVDLLVSSRSKSSADRFAAKLRKSAPNASIAGVKLDHFSESFASDLKSLQPHVVVHTAGPFQGQNYDVAKACIACGSHYIDLADGRHFVEVFPSELNQAAEKAEVLLVTGASTLPGLSSAVVLELTDGWQSVESLDISIAPAQQTPRGLSTIRAVLSYCGKPFDIFVSGQWRRHYGWQSLNLRHYSNWGLRLSAVCDVPDLSLFKQRFPTLETVIFRAALESKLEHLALWTFASLTRLGVVRNWADFASYFQKISYLAQRLGGDIGGMQLDIVGRNEDGAPVNCHWKLVAGENHGPEIPVSPALVLVRKLVRGEISLRGAHSCFGLMSLADFAAEVDQLEIRWSHVYVTASVAS